MGPETREPDNTSAPPGSTAIGPMTRASLTHTDSPIPTVIGPTTPPVSVRLQGGGSTSPAVWLSSTEIVREGGLATARSSNASPLKSRVAAQLGKRPVGRVPAKTKL